MKSKYLEKFKSLQSEEAKANFRLNGGRLLVEIFPPKELKTASGLVISAPSNMARGSTAESMRSVLAIVLLTGSGYFGDNGEDIPIDVPIGAIVLISDMDIKTFSTFPGIDDYTQNTLALIPENAIQMQFPTLESFQNYESFLNGPGKI